MTDAPALFLFFVGYSSVSSFPRKRESILIFLLVEKQFPLGESQSFHCPSASG